MIDPDPMPDAGELPPLQHMRLRRAKAKRLSSPAGVAGIPEVVTGSRSCSFLQNVFDIPCLPVHSPSRELCRIRKDLSRCYRQREINPRRHRRPRGHIAGHLDGEESGQRIARAVTTLQMHRILVGDAYPLTGDVQPSSGPLSPYTGEVRRKFDFRSVAGVVVETPMNGEPPRESRLLS